MMLPWDIPAAIKLTCQAALTTVWASIDFTTLRTPRDLCQPIAAWRGRPLVILAFPLPRCVDGMWLDVLDPESQERMDIIVVAADAPTCDQDHALLHELAHLILGHDAVLLPHEPRGFLASITAASRAISAAYEHGCQASAEEQAAEVLAMLLEDAFLTAHDHVSVPAA